MAGTLATASPGRRGRSIAITAGGLAVLLGALDTYVVIGLLHQIIDSLRIPVNRLEQVTPIVTGYLLGYVAAMPLLGQASDRYGRKMLLQLCLGGFLIGSLITALAPGLPILVTGRLVQGVASGALLPVTMALAADLWSERKRATVLGGVGAAQELGSVLGPLYGIGLAAVAGWRGVFWVNIPLAVIAIIAVHVSLPGGRRGERRPVDVPGGALLALTLALLVIGLYNPEPRTRVLPPWGVPFLIAAAVSLIAFLLWERRSRTKLVDVSSMRRGPFLAALATSLAAGAALMVTLVDVDLFAQTLLGMDDQGAVTLLLRFLIALPIGAVLGGVLAARVGDRWVAAAGMVIAAAGFLLVSGWEIGILGDRHDLGVVALPRLDTDLAILGFGLGVVIAPVSAAVLRSAPPEQHGVASAAIVVARMTGMLIGVAALSAWGLRRFHALTGELDPPIKFLFPDDASYETARTAYLTGLREALVTQYSEIFLISAGLCVLGAVTALFITPRRTPTPT